MSSDLWINPIEVVSLLSAYVKSDNAAKKIIAERFKDGEIKVSALYFTEGVDFGKIPSISMDRLEGRECREDSRDGMERVILDDGWPEVSDKIGSRYIMSEIKLKVPGKRFIIGGAVPRYSKNWKADLRRWDWQLGTFVFSRPPVFITSSESVKIPYRWRLSTREVIYGAKFDREDVNKMLSSFRTKAAAPAIALNHTTKRRRSARKFDWTDLYLNLVVYTYLYGLNDGFEDFESTGWQRALELWIEHYYADLGVDVGGTVIRSEAQKLIEAISLEKNSSRLPKFEALKPT